MKARTQPTYAPYSRLRQSMSSGFWAQMVTSTTIPYHRSVSEFPRFFKKDFFFYLPGKQHVLNFNIVGAVFPKKKCATLMLLAVVDRKNQVMRCADSGERARAKLMTVPWDGGK